jgi:hypothetical protein
MGKTTTNLASQMRLTQSSPLQIGIMIADLKGPIRMYFAMPIMAVSSFVCGKGCGFDMAIKGFVKFLHGDLRIKHDRFFFHVVPPLNIVQNSNISLNM